MMEKDLADIREALSYAGLSFDAVLSEYREFRNGNKKRSAAKKAPEKVSFSHLIRPEF